MSSQGLEVLDRDECVALLSTQGIGRVGILHGEQPAILPVNYAMWNGDVVFRTDPGTKLMAAVLRTRVAFEVDHSEGFTHEGWSVLVVGHADEVIEPDDIEAVNRLSLRPWADGDRDRIVRIRAEQITGRRLRHQT